MHAMLPLRRRLVVEREPAERTTAWGLVLGVDDRGFAHYGRVLAASAAPMDVAVGERVVYSSRIDTYHVGAPPRAVDIVEEASVIGKLAPC